MDEERDRAKFFPYEKNFQCRNCTNDLFSNKMWINSSATTHYFRNPIEGQYRMHNYTNKQFIRFYCKNWDKLVAVWDLKKEWEKGVAVEIWRENLIYDSTNDTITI